jgi:hypothetical protein
MLTAINLYGKATFNADEVHYEFPDGMLLAKSVTVELTFSEMAPQALLCISEIASQPSGRGSRACCQSCHVF